MKSARPVTLRSRLVRDLSLLVIGFGLLAVGVMAVGTRWAARSLAEITMGQALAVTESRLDGFFEGVEEHLAVIERQCTSGVLAVDPGDPDDADPEATLARREGDRVAILAPIIEASEAISSIIIADDRGREHLLMQMPEQWRSRLLAAEEWTEARTRTWPAAAGTSTAAAAAGVVQRQAIAYDPRERPWFRGAMEAGPGRRHWTEPYRFFSTGRLGMTVAVRHDEGEGGWPARVVASDVLLDDITEFARTLGVGERGIAAILTVDGRLVGLPGLPAFDDPAARDEAYLKRPDELKLALIEDAVAVRREMAADSRAIFRFSSEGEPWWGASEPYQFRSGLVLRIAVLVPEQDLLGPLVGLRPAIAAAAGLVLLVGVARAGVVARRFTAPIEAIVQESDRITRGDLEAGGRIESPFAEIRRLVDAHDHLRDGLAARIRLEKVERDLDIAREIQRGLMPSAAPAAEGFLIAGWNRPADETGGDYYDWMSLPDGRILIALADATGHGIGPALIIAVCRAYLRAAAMVMGTGDALQEALARVNDLLHADIPSGTFVTAAIGVLDPVAGELQLLSAGQAPIHFRHADGRLETWDADTIPLGVVSPLPPAAPRRIRLQPGDTLLLTTDGFFEWPSPDGELFGLARLEAMIAEGGGDDPEAFIPRLHAALLAHAGDRPQPDDLTVLIVQRPAEGRPVG